GQTGIFCLAPGRAILAQAHHDVDARVVQVECMGVALGTITNDGYCLALDQGQITVLVVKNFHSLLRIEPPSAAAVLIRKKKRVQSLSTRSPRPTPDTPVRTVSRMALLSSAPMKAWIFSWMPVSSMV